MMKVTVTEASKAFGQLVDDVQSESVTIERNGLLKGPVKAPLNNGNRAQRSAEASRARRVAQVMAVALGKWRKRGPPPRWTLQGPPCGAFRQTRTPRCHFSTGNQPAFKAAP